MVAEAPLQQRGTGLMNGRLASVAVSYSRLALVGACSLVAVSCASAPTNAASNLQLTLAGDRVSFEQLQHALVDGLSREHEPYVVLRTSWAVSPVALQDLLQCVWSAGADEVLLQERAAIGNTDAAFKIEPSMRHGYDWSGETRGRYLGTVGIGPSPPYVSILRPVHSSNREP